MKCHMQQPHDLSTDGFTTPNVGWWAKRKYHFLERYLRIFSTGMKNSWEHRQYIDLFSGAGVAKIQGTGELVFTSSLIAARMQDPFTYLHLCEQDQSNCDALKRRIEKHAPTAKYKIYQGNANESIDEILNGIPFRKCLAVAFVDPFGLHFDFETARKLSARKVDLIILLADNMDAMRNWKKYYEDNPESNMDKFMGESGWRKEFNNTPNDNFPEKFRKRYIERLRTLGYKHFGTERVQNSRNCDIYTLLFATANPRGLDFWEKAQSVDEAGQRNLFI